MWNVVIESNSTSNLNLIFPTQQKDVDNAVSLLRKSDNIEKIIIFGSSVTSACNPWSDIDIYIQMMRDEPIHLPKADVPWDVWTNFTVDENLFHEIIESGVVVYER